MAIRFLNAINVDGSITATINQDANNAYDGILVSTSGLIERRTKAQILSDIGAGTMSSWTFAGSSGGSSSTISDGGTATIIAGSGITATGNGSGGVTIAATLSGYANWVLDGDSGPSQTINSTNTATFAGGTAISTVASATDTLTINLDDTAVTPGSYTLASITVDQQGRITAASSGSSGSMSNWKIGSTSGTDQTVTNGQTVDIVGGTGISGSVGGTRTVTLSLDNTGVTAGSYTSANITVNAQGQITAASDGGAGTMTSWTLQGDSGTNLTVSNADVVDIAGGTGISTATTASGMTVTNSLPFNSITLASSTGSNSTITNQDTITIAAGSNITTTNNGSGTVTIAYTGGTGTMSSFTLDADTGTSQSITNGNTLTIAGSTGIDTVVGNTDTVTVNLDLSELSTVTTIDPAADFLVGVDGTANEKILYQNVHLNQWGDAEANIAMGSNKITGLANATASTDATNLGQVQSLIAGVGVFQGGYNASTNSPALTGGSNVALDTGDFYAVTTGGSFFTLTLEPGDLIFAATDIAASSTPSLTDYTVVQSGQSIATAAATDGASVKGIAGFDSANFQVTGNGWTQLKNSGVSAGSYGSASKSLSATVTAKGLLTSLSQQDIDITASQVSDFCTAVSTCIASNEQYTADIGGATSIAVTHNLGTRDVMVQLYDNSSYDTVYADVTRNTVNQVTVDFTTAPSANDIRILITKVS